MARHGCSLLLVLAALAAASSAPAYNASTPLSLHPPSSDLPLAEQAARQGFTLPPRKVRSKVAVDATARGAQAYPFGMADPQPPQRSRQGKLDADTRAKRAADDIYDETKLPTNVVPTRYTVIMAPNLATGIFYGATDIYIDVVEATSRIILHGAPDITFNPIQILKKNAEGTFVDNGKATLVPLGMQEDLERLVIDLETELVVGQNYLLRFPLFGAYLRDDLKGFYLSSYESYGQKVVLATTQFEPPAARFAFPCFDEPALKAVFQIVVEHDGNLMARSNMPAKSITSPTLAILRTEFEETKLMSTYLLAWVVSDFAGLAAPSDATLTTWGRSNLLNDDTARIANMVGPKALQLLGEFNGIKYELPKMDQFAIPDFDAGAMENWGIVTYREEYLLETSDTTIRIREFIATTVCHEFGHQWTGDLVTLDWWSNTWLNEGFATYFENVICDKIFPDWNLMDKYVTDNVHVGIAHDVMPGQVAMSSPAFSTPAISAKFDRISYKKGGSVLRMFEHILGTEVFKKAMNRYLSANSYKTGSPDRLFSAMNAEAVAASAPLPPNTDFATMAKTWTEQAGVPVVTVTRNTAQGAVNISQEQFFYETPEDQEATATLWYVPIPEIVNPKTKDWTKTAPARWLTPEAPSIANLDVDASASEWIVVNPKQIGYYLVNYDAENWKLLHQALLSTPAELHPSTRTQLVHDALAMARAGRLDYATALPFLQALKGERSPAAWKAGVEALAFLRDRLAITEAGTALRAFIRQITADVYDEVGLGSNATAPTADTSKDEERFLRFLITSYACYAGHENCVDDAVTAVDQLFEKGVRPNADVRDAALCYAVQNSDSAFNSVIERYMETSDSKERGQYAAALSCTMNRPLLELLMDGIIVKQDDTTLNAADLQQLINAILSRWENHRFMLNYYKMKWHRIYTFTDNSFYVNVLNALIGDIRTEAELQEVKAFVEKTFSATSTARQEFDLRLDAADKGLAWNRKHFAEVAKWLYTTTGTGPVTPVEPTAAPAASTTNPPTSKAPTSAGPATRSTTMKPAPTTPPTPNTTRKNAASQAAGMASLVATALLALLLR